MHMAVGQVLLFLFNCLYYFGLLCFIVFYFFPQSKEVPKLGEGCILCPPDMPLELVRRHLAPLEL